MTSTYTAYAGVTRDMPATRERVGALGANKREIDAYLARIGSVRTIDAFVSDKRLLRFALAAHGLGTLGKATAFVRKLLEEGIDRPDSLANSLSDGRYREFVRSFNFARHGEAATAFDRAQQGVVDKFLDQSLEEDAGRASDGLRLALYFRRKAPTIADHYAILADKALAQVVRTALGISDMTAFADVDRQARFLAGRVDLADFRNPQRLDKFIIRFCAMWDNARTRFSPPAGAVPATPSSLVTMSNDVLTAIQTLKR